MEEDVKNIVIDVDGTRYRGEVIRASVYNGRMTIAVKGSIPISFPVEELVADGSRKVAPKPCPQCGCSVCVPEDIMAVYCTNDACDYVGPLRDTYEEAVRAHNETCDGKKA